MRKRSSGPKPNQSSNAQQLRQRNRELTIINEIAAALNRSVDLDQALQATLARVATLLDLQTGWVWLLHEETGESYLAATQNLPPALSRNPRRMEGWCYCLDTYRTGDLSGAANVNVVTCSRLKGLVDGTDGLRYHASIPLYALDKKLGVLNVASPDWRELSPDDLRLLHTVGDLLSIAVERARLFEKSTRLGAVEERNRLARDIHDTLAQGLTAVALHLESAEALLDAGQRDEAVRRAVDQALTLTRANLEEARRSVLELRAAPLEGKSIAQALADLAHANTAKGGARVRLNMTGASRPLPAYIEAGLYRIVQEALQNIDRHASAHLVVIHLAIGADAVDCAITDDGRGFDPSAVEIGHYGLVGLNERARLMGGTLRIESTPGLGTHLVLHVPLGVVQ